MLSFEEIQQKALEIGWDDVGITEATLPEADLKAYQKWLQAGYHGNLTYMESQARLDPNLVLKGAKSALLFVTYYKQEKKEFKTNQGLIASYARGKDYHHIHRKRLKKMILWMEEKTGLKEIAKGFSDSTPILEKALAAQAGLGFMGKNTLLIHRKFGTFILLSGLLTTLEIKGKVLPTNIPKCGSCTRCLDACPTQAFVSPYILDATKCLSYHLIESKEIIPNEIKNKNPGYIFGCDICQDACPHNVRKKTSPHLEFTQGIGDYIDLKTLELLRKEPERLHGTPLQRKKVDGLIQNFESLSLN